LAAGSAASAGGLDQHSGRIEEKSNFGFPTSKLQTASNFISWKIQINTEIGAIAVQVTSWKYYSENLEPF
jgi:hypothetical protein